MTKKIADNVHDISYYAKDGRLTGEPDGAHYQWEKLLEKFGQLGRPLTEEEAKEYRKKI